MYYYIRDASGYHSTDEVGEVYRSVERLCWLCLFAEGEGNNENANRGLLTGQEVSFEGATLNSPRKVAARAAAKARIGAKLMSGKRSNRHMRCLGTPEGFTVGGNTYRVPLGR